MITYKDFVPKRSAQDITTKGVEYETFDAAVTAANEWMQQQSAKILNVETVVLPNIYRMRERGTTDADLRAAEDDDTNWHQFVRVWYEVG
jgi:hypothetical protein